jgi:hypothetical protein
MKPRKEKRPPHEVEGPVRRPEDLDRAGSGGPYGHTVPEPRPRPAPDKTPG